MVKVSPAAPPPSAEPTLSFVKDVQPILQASCVSCHGDGRNKGKFNLDTRASLLAGGRDGPAVVPGKSDQSLLIKLVTSTDEKEVMPAKGARLTDEQVSTLRAWIDGGVEWPEGFTFARGSKYPVTPRRVEVPEVADVRMDNPIDRLLRPYYLKNDVDLGPVVDDRTFARRVWLDLVGLLPPPAELDAFVRDASPNKRGALARRLLDDRHAYAAHWLSFWNDALRNDYAGTGYIDGGRKQITPWLYKALASNMPYDEFVRKLVSGAKGTEGFTNGIVWRGVVNASQVPPMQAAQNVSQVFMGVNLKCASCHDSFVNQWKLSDAYGLAGVFSEGKLEMARCDAPLGESAEVKFLYADLGAINADAPRAERMKQLAQLMTTERNGRLTRTIINRLWQRLMGRGLVEPADEMDNDPWNVDLLDWLAVDLADHKYDLKHTIERIVTSRAYQARSVGATEGDAAFVFRGPVVKRMSAEQFVDAVAAVTGAPPGQLGVRAPDGPEPPKRTNTPKAVVVPAEAVAEPRAALCRADQLTTALGRPNREQVVTARESAATTLQALELTNGAVLTQMLETGGKRFAERKAKAPDLVRDVYVRSLGRAPTKDELKAAQQAIGRKPNAEGVEDLLWAIVMLPEFQLIR